MKPRDPRSRRAPRGAQRRRLLRQRRAIAQTLLDRHDNNVLLQRFPLRGRRIRRRAVTFTMREIERLGRMTRRAVTTRVVEHVCGQGEGLGMLLPDVSGLMADLFVRVTLWIVIESLKRRPGGVIACPERESLNET